MMFMMMMICDLTGSSSHYPPRNRGDACVRGVVWSEGWIHDSHQVGCMDTDVTRSWGIPNMSLGNW